MWGAHVLSRSPNFIPKYASYACFIKLVTEFLWGRRVYSHTDVAKYIRLIFTQSSCWCSKFYQKYITIWQYIAVRQGWPTFWFHAPIYFILNSDAPHKHSLPFSPLKRVVIWTYFEVIITYFYLKNICFILYNKHINKHYQIYLIIMMTDIAVVEENISHNTFQFYLIILLQKVLMIIYEHD